MKIIPINSTRIYTRSNNQLNYTNMTPPQDTVSFSGSIENLESKLSTAFSSSLLFVITFLKNFQIFLMK